MLRQLTTSLTRVAMNLPMTTGRAMGAIRQQSTDYSPACDGLSVETKNNLLWIKLNRPKKFNAITREMYEGLTATFTKVNSDPSIRAVILTGAGDYYSSGNDLSNFTRAMADPEGPKAGLKNSQEILIRFVDSLILLEKFLIAAVNGPAVGIPVTTLPLCDYVLASTKATFQTPFTALGQCPEACSSFTIPQMMGRTRASELLLLNKIWSAKKAYDYGLVSEVIEEDKFKEHLDKFLEKTILKSCYPNSMLVSKSLIQNKETKSKLLEVNRRECEVILECWLGEECAHAVQEFFRRQSGTKS